MSLAMAIRRALNPTDGGTPYRVRHLGADDYEIIGRAPATIKDALQDAGMAVYVRKVAYQRVVVAVKA